MSTSLEGQSVVGVGGSTGIGWAVAELAAKACAVVDVDGGVLL